MDAATVSEVQAIAEAARAQEEGARKLAERAERLLTNIMMKAAKSPETADLKRADGRLTEAGIAAVNAAFDSGETVSKVSKQFGIHVSAASNRRTIWLSRKATSAKA